MVDLPRELPPGTPSGMKRTYVVAFFVAALLDVAAYAIKQIPPISSGMYDICRQTHVCAPPPLKDLPPLASGFEKGNTVDHASKAQFDKYSGENPGWEICLKNTRSLESHGPFNSNYEYRMEGTFYGVPQWRGLFALLGDFFAGRDYKPEACTKG